MKLWPVLAGIAASGLVAPQLVSCSGARSTPISSTEPKHSHRSTIKPTGTLHVVVTRANSSPYRLVDMNDRGDVLYLASKRGAKIREYIHEYKGNLVERREAKDGNNFSLCPSGLLFQDLRDPFQELVPSAEFPFNADLGMPKLFSDGSVLVIRSKHDRMNAREHYALDRDTQSEMPLKLVVSTGTRVSPVLSKSPPRPAAPTVGGPPVLLSSGSGSAGTGMGSVQLYSRIKEIYASAAPITLLEKGDSDVIWIREHFGNSKTGKDELLKISGPKPTNVSMPTGYSNVMRVVNTGGLVAATFGNLGDEQPIRSYVLTESTWKELPMPNVFEFSFVQKILFNGSIVGFVTTSDGKSIRQVVWKGDSLAILNDLPGWPKQGQLTIIMLTTRSGQLYVRSVLNSESNAGDYYLLSILVEP